MSMIPYQGLERPFCDRFIFASCGYACYQLSTCDEGCRALSAPLRSRSCARDEIGRASLAVSQCHTARMVVGRRRRSQARVTVAGSSAGGSRKRVAGVGRRRVSGLKLGRARTEKHPSANPVSGLRRSRVRTEIRAVSGLIRGGGASVSRGWARWRGVDIRGGGGGK